MNTYLTSSGERVTQREINDLTSAAKFKVLQDQKNHLGYNVCTECFRNDCVPIDCSHDISVKKAKETGRTELCWSIKNIKIIGRRHHKVKDGLNLQFTG